MRLFSISEPFFNIICGTLVIVRCVWNVRTGPSQAPPKPICNNAYIKSNCTDFLKGNFIQVPCYVVSKPKQHYLSLFNTKHASTIKGIWSEVHPPFRHCDTSTRTIWHCNDLSQEPFCIVAIQTHRVWTLRPPPKPLNLTSQKWVETFAVTVRPMSRPNLT